MQSAGASADVEVLAEGMRGAALFREAKDSGVDVFGAHIRCADSSLSKER